MVNPYYWLFYLIYKLLKPLSKDKDRLSFGVSSIMGMILIIHGLITLIIIEEVFHLEMILPQMHKFLFGTIVLILYFSLNHFIFEKNNRYLDIMVRIEQEKMYKKVNTLIILLIYLFLPLSIVILF